MGGGGILARKRMLGLGIVEWGGGRGWGIECLLKNCAK